MRHVRLLRSRSVRVLWLSMTLSVLGDRLYALAAMWVVYEATGSSSRMGLVAAVESLPYIALGGAGTVVGRFSRWRSLAWLDTARAAVALALPVLWSPDSFGFALTLGLVLLLGTLGALFDPNLGTLVPQLVTPDEVAQASCLFDLTSRVAGVVGQGSAGALLLLVSEVQLFAIDGLTFAVSAAALAWLGRRTARRKSAAAARGPLPAVRARRLLREQRRTATAIAVHAVALFASAVSTVGLPPLLVARFGQGAAGYGLALAATAAGGLAGNLLTGNTLTTRLPDEQNWLGTYCFAWAVSGLALAGLGVADRMAAVIALCIVTGLLFPVCTVTFRAHLARFAPPARLRLLTVDQMAAHAASVAGMLLLPFAVDAAPGASFVAAGALLWCAATAGWYLAGRARPLPAGT
ncbi:MFS transporter [Streptomyces sp. NPDC049555]|uniref:MFS transporter n=1 Tax=Streptomyces sp. NPDC049555 TaxID=3154930 RepID=UPI003434A870